MTSTFNIDIYIDIVSRSLCISRHKTDKPTDPDRRRANEGKTARTVDIAILFPAVEIKLNPHHLFVYSSSEYEANIPGKASFISLIILFFN